MSRSLFLASATLAAATLSVSVDAHTNMAVPKVQFPDGFYNGNSPMGRINGDLFPSAASIASYQGVQKIAKVMESYKTLRQLIMANVNVSTISGHTGTKECGLTITTGEKQPLPDAIDFPWGHPGPCEVWCDNTRIFYNADCQGNNVGKVPVDKAKCQGVSIIQGMYIGVHVSNWEVYANCAPIVGGTKTDAATLFSDTASGSGASSSGGAATSGSTGEDADGSGSTNATPSLTPATSATPSTSSGSGSVDTGSDGSDGSSATTTVPSTPAPTTTAPTPTSGSGSKAKCNRRVRD